MTPGGLQSDYYYFDHFYCKYCNITSSNEIQPDYPRYTQADISTLINSFSVVD